MSGFKVQTYRYGLFRDRLQVQEIPSRRNRTDPEASRRLRGAPAVQVCQDLALAVLVDK